MQVGAESIGSPEQLSYAPGQAHREHNPPPPPPLAPSNERRRHLGSSRGKMHNSARKTVLHAHTHNDLINKRMHNTILRGAASEPCSEAQERDRISSSARPPIVAFRVLVFVVDRLRRVSNFSSRRRQRMGAVPSTAFAVTPCSAKNKLRGSQSWLCKVRWTGQGRSWLAI